MILSGYEEVEHTADIALRVWGADFFTLLKESAKGMYELMGVIENPGLPMKVIFTIGHGSNEMQLVDFLNEVLYLMESQAGYYDNFTFINTDEGINVHASGYKIISYQRNIKAVTFHDLEVIETKGRFETTITFDV
ncbi:MAG: archease [Chloroflexota bacterium]|nr:archease [Chloroflexota bacterium]